MWALALTCLALTLLLGIFIYRKRTIRNHKNDILHLKYLIPKNLTLKQLKEYDGLNGKPIYIAVNKRIFDVSQQADHYGPQGPYGLFAGRDATKSLAKFNLSDITDEPIDLSELTTKEMESVKEWELQFQEKYPCVGRLIDIGEDTNEYDHFVAEALKNDTNLVSTLEIPIEHRLQRLFHSQSDPSLNNINEVLLMDDATNKSQPSIVEKNKKNSFIKTDSSYLSSRMSLPTACNFEINQRQRSILTDTTIPTANHDNDYENTILNFINSNQDVLGANMYNRFNDHHNSTSFLNSPKMVSFDIKDKME